MGISDRPVVSSLLYADEDGNPVLARSGSLINMPIDMGVAVGVASGSSGLASGYASVSATTIVPVRATTYTEAPAGSNLEVVSSSASDTSAGTGTRTLRVVYYRNDGTGPFTVDITMNGTTAVSIGDSNARFVEKLESLTVGSNGTNVGTITIRREDNTTIGTMVAGDGTTFWAHHYVAAGRTCFIRRVIVGIFSNALLGTLAGNVFVRIRTPLITNAFEKQATPLIRTREADISGCYDLADSLYVSGFAQVTLHVRPDAATAGTFHGGLVYCDV